MLTLLCSTTGWSAGNVATKYLGIIKNSLFISENSGDNIDTIEIFEIVSIAIFDIFRIIIRKLQNIEKIPLTYDDKQLIYNLAYCISIISTETPYIILSTMEVVFDSHNSIMLRTPQQKGVEFLLSKLIPAFILQVLMDIIFINMKTGAHVNSSYDFLF